MSSLDKVFEKVIKDKARTIPGKARIIEKAKQSGRLLAVSGGMDYVEKVLPYCYAAEKQLIGPKDSPPDLQNFDAIFVGCPGRVRLEQWQGSLIKFVQEGGLLLTTDWSLNHMIEKLFPHTIRKKGSAHGTFPLRVRMPGHPLLEGISDCDGTPWVVEASSHRIEVIDPKRVQVILDAPKMGEPSAVLVAFEFGKGMVVHAISHFHLQGSEASGEYVSAYVLTNVIDEAIRRRYPEPMAPRIRLIDKSEPSSPPRIRILKSS